MILHISNAFLGSKVHKNLYKSLDEESVGQVIYTVVRNYKKPKEENFINFDVPDSRIVLARTVLKTHHRIFFYLKIRTLYKDLKQQTDLREIKGVHATTLFTDGALALKVFREFNKPYIITVRNTDINYFFKYRPDLVGLAHKILKYADKIVFISPALKESFLGHRFIRNHRNSLEKKSTVIHNGIENFWIDNRNELASINSNKFHPHKILFVGRISKEKNLSRLIESVVSLTEKYPEISLTLVGPWGDDEMQIKNLVARHPGIISWYGEVREQKELLEIYRNHHFFAMPSTKETFGLVYLEALSQGLPVLYAKGQGFDGVLVEKVGVSVNAGFQKDIEKGIEHIIDHYEDYLPKAIDFEKFRWKEIALTYAQLYRSLNVIR